MPHKDKKKRRDYLKKYVEKHKKEIIVKQKEYRLKNKDKYRNLKIKYRKNLKIEVLKHYGNGILACVLCGESHPACLSIDHVDGNGSKHRRELGLKTSRQFYQWLRTNRYPEGYQTLCMNCQFIKRDGRKEYENNNLG